MKNKIEGVRTSEKMATNCTPAPFKFKIGETVMGLSSSLGLDIVVAGKVISAEHRFDREHPGTFLGNQYKVGLDASILPIESYPRSIAVVEGTYYLGESNLRAFEKERFHKALQEWFVFRSATVLTQRSKDLLLTEMYGESAHVPADRHCGKKHERVKKNGTN